MPYGGVKFDTITFTNAGADTTTTVSGLYASTTSGLTVTGTISGNLIQGTTVSGVTVTGTTANFTSGVFTALSGTTTTVTSGIFGAGTAAAPSIAFTGDPNTGIYSPGADQLSVATNGSARLTIDSNGNVGVVSGGNLGINGASPQSPLDVISNASGYGISLRGRSGDSLAQFRFTSNNHDTIYALLETAPTYLAAQVNGSERLRITSAGLVGIGTSSPSRTLDVVGTAKFSNGTADVTIYGDLTTAGALGTNSNFPLALYTNGTERLRIDSSGRLLVGMSAARDVGGLGNSTRVGGINVEASGDVVNVFSATINRNDTNGAYLALAHSRGTTAGSNTILQSGDAFGTIYFAGADGTDLNSLGARIDGVVDGTPGANDMPGRLVFSTTADGASSPTERMRIDSAGRVLVGTATANTSGAKLQTSDGLTFTATQVASADPNTLDDYEEGTWTPVVSFGGASVGITGTFSGTYTKVGNVVTITYTLEFASKGSSTGSMLVSGMPFSGGLDIISGFGYVHRLAALQIAGQLYMRVSGTTLIPNFVGYNSGNTTALTDTDIANTTDIRGGVVFRV